MKAFKTIFSTVLFLAFLGFSSHTKAQISQGDIAIVGYNHDVTPKELAIVTLAEIPSGQVIRISNFAWSAANAFETGGFTDGAITWTLTSSVPAGTVIKITVIGNGSVGVSDGTPVVGGGLTAFGTIAVTGWTGTSTSVPTASGGGNWFIYQGTSPSATPSNWIFGFANWSTNSAGANAWQTSEPLGSTSYLPSALTNGVNAIALTSQTAPGRHADNLVYTGTRNGSKATILAALVTLTNWTGNETTSYDINPGGSRFT